ncbi:MAG TPA: RNA methyltransferase [Candidatus Polarisedimenticolaceae bacterium]|nr:RNA methyltransferase [Candidatus Polarisedimenticolaceae bacterium]
MPSRNHPLARRLKALRGDRALRDAEGVLVAEGVHLAQEALAAGAAIEGAVASPRLLETIEGRDLARRIAAARVATLETSDEELRTLTDARTPQPIAVIVRRAAPALGEVVPGGGAPALCLVACGVQDPGNLGALLRSADAAGATGFLAVAGGVSLTHPRAVRASMGAIFRLRAAEADLNEALDRIGGLEIRIVGAAPRDGVAYDAFDWRPPVALLLGGEGAGLPRSAVARIGARVAIPMAKRVESLSVNAAGAVLLFEAARQRR